MSKRIRTKIIKLTLGLLIAVLAGYLWTYRLGQVPSGLYVDEATVGYNAFSILKTGRDEYGKSFPILFRLFGSYTPPLFVYALIPFIAVGGLKIEVIRWLSVLAAAVWAGAIFAFLREKKGNGWLSYLGLLVFVISPWAVFFARVGYEVTLGAALFMWGAYGVWKGMLRPPWRVIGAVILSLSTYAAHTERYLAVMFIISVAIVFKDKWKENKKWSWLAMAVFILIQLPLLSLAGTPAFWNKGALFNAVPIANFAKAYFSWLPSWAGWPIGFVRTVGGQWLTYFSPRSLFWLPDPDWQRSIPQLSVFYSWMVVPYVAGLYELWKDRKSDWSKYLWIFLLVAPVPAALVGDPFSSQRALPVFGGLAMVITLGIKRWRDAVTALWLKIGMGIILLGISGIYLWRGYFVFMPQERAEIWGYGVDQLAEIIKDDPEEIYVIDQARLKPIYIQLAFFWRYPPDKFQQESGRDLGNRYYLDTKYNPEYQFANVETRSIVWEQDIYKRQVLVGDQLAVSEEQVKEHFLTPVFELKGITGEIWLRGYRTNPAAKCKSNPTDSHCRNI
jgi:hypothetical protein